MRFLRRFQQRRERQKKNHKLSKPTSELEALSQTDTSSESELSERDTAIMGLVDEILSPSLVLVQPEDSQLTLMQLKQKMFQTLNRIVSQTFGKNDRDDFTQNRLLPLAVAAYPNKPNLIAILLAAYPQAIYQADEHGQLPIHTAVQSLSQPKILVSLRGSSSNNTFAQPDRQGRLPLHLACRVGRSFSYQRCQEMVQTCLDQYPAALTCPDHQGRLPIHTALDADASNDVISLLLSHRGSDPATVEQVLHTADHQGRLPIHAALDMYHCESWQQRLEEKRILKLLASDTSSSHISHRDKLGRLPLHIALQRSASHAVVAALLQRDPSTIDMPSNIYAPRLPWEIALDSDLPVNVIYLLIRRDPGLLLGTLAHSP